jgi:hypothetical protein
MVILAFAELREDLSSQLVVQVVVADAKIVDNDVHTRLL